MGKQQIWNKITSLRKIIKEKKTRIVKDNRTGKTKGGVILTDETLNPFKDELAALEAKMAKEKKKCASVSEWTLPQEEVMADASQNKEEIKEYIVEQFTKLSPKKFNNVNKRDNTAPCAKRLKLSGETKLTPAPLVVEPQTASSSDFSILAC